MKKIFSVLLAISVIATCFVQTGYASQAGFVPDENGVLWMEAEDAINNSGISASENPSASNQKVMAFAQTLIEDEVTFSFEFEVAGTQNYDIWLLGTDPSITWISQPWFSINNGERFRAQALSVAGPYNVFLAGADLNVGWAKVAGAEHFEAGVVNTLEYALPIRNEQDRMIIGAIDTIAVVPSDWGWVPSGTIEKPAGETARFEPDENGVVWMEAENVGDIGHFNIYDLNPSASGQKYLYSDTANEDGQIVLKFTFNVKDAKEYDIWLLGTDPSIGWISQPVFSVNGADAVKAGSLSTAGVYTAFLAGATLDVGWAKIASAQVLSADGINTLEYSLPIRNEQDRMVIGAIDTIAIVPSEWEWKPDANIDIPTGPVEKVFYQAADGLIWMEAEKAVFDDGYAVVTHPNASAGTALQVSTTEVSENEKQTYDVSFDFMVDKADAYDVWVISIEPNAGWLSDWRIGIDGESSEMITKGKCGFDYAQDGAPLYSLWYSAGAEISNHWVKLENGKVFESGKHNITFEAPPRADFWYLCSVDTMVVVPSSWNWMPEKGQIKEPSRIGNGFAYIELESPYESGGIFESVTTENLAEASNASGKGLLFADNLSNDTDELLSYNFSLDETGEYDIWYLGTPVEANYLSKLYWNIDNKTQYNEAVRDGSFFSEYEIIGHSLGWQKIATQKIIPYGEHTLDLKYVAREDNLHYLRADAIAVVPSNWGWEPEEEVAQDRIKVMLDAFYAYNRLESLYNGYAYENLDFSADKIGCAGSGYTYTSLTPQTVTDNGEIIRPSFGQEDTIGIINLTAGNAVAESDEFQWIFTIPAMGRIEVSEYNVKYSDGADVEDILVAGKSVNAGATLKINTGDENLQASMYAALYSEDGVLEKVECATAALTAQPQQINVSLDLPEGDLSGYTLKVFLWEDMTPIK